MNDDNEMTPKAQKHQRWETKILEKTLMASVIEHRRSRRWGIFFKLLLAFYVLVIILIFASRNLGQAVEIGEEHTAIIDIEGMISASSKTNAEDVNASLRSAFDNDNAKGIILKINSPGGSPVQAGEIYDEVLRLKTEYPDKTVYAVIGDVGASAAYYIAASADEIYANRSSLVGSIGVLINGFGFVDTLEKLGVERRLITAGEHKGFLDPFSPLSESDLEFAHQMIEEAHQQFIDKVKEGRGDRLLDAQHPELFSGLAWIGDQALDLGLVDGLGDSYYVSHTLIGTDKNVNYTKQISVFDRLAGQIGSSMVNAITQWQMQ